MLRNTYSIAAFQSHLLFPWLPLQCRLSKCRSLGALWYTIPVNIYILSLPILGWNMLKGCIGDASAFYSLFTLVSKSEILWGWQLEVCCNLTFLERFKPLQLILILKKLQVEGYIYRYDMGLCLTQIHKWNLQVWTPALPTGQNQSSHLNKSWKPHLPASPNQCNSNRSWSQVPWIFPCRIPRRAELYVRDISTVFEATFLL